MILSRLRLAALAGVVVILAGAGATIWFLHKRNETLAAEAALEAARVKQLQATLETTVAAHEADLQALEAVQAANRASSAQLKTLRQQLGRDANPNACPPSPAVTGVLRGLRRAPALDGTGDPAAPGQPAGVR